MTCKGLNSSKMFRHEEKLTLVQVRTFLKNSANIITTFKTGFTVSRNHPGTSEHEQTMNFLVIVSEANYE